MGLSVCASTRYENQQQQSILTDIMRVCKASSILSPLQPPPHHILSCPPPPWFTHGPRGLCGGLLLVDHLQDAADAAEDVEAAERSIVTAGQVDQADTIFLAEATAPQVGVIGEAGISADVPLQRWGANLTWIKYRRRTGWRTITTPANSQVLGRVIDRSDISLGELVRGVFLHIFVGRIDDLLLRWGLFRTSDNVLSGAG